MWGNGLKLFCVEKVWFVGVILISAENFYLFFSSVWCWMCMAIHAKDVSYNISAVQEQCCLHA
jgi:hypothetical protein